ncbi:hypothetical protein IFM89_007885 [Coptis chinensis]|uniref:Glycoside hydrolase family 5 domain-containing protein n=1 Tax=Coptis chinensis TaxID=261450 RepID=A0A835HG22_9MAGN|nr:hypothetical protein IFM89_007885 [Coptis chinensis]
MHHSRTNFINITKFIDYDSSQLITYYCNIRYMQQGAEAVHAANPDVLVILSGLEFDKNLTFLRNKQVKLSFTRKLVFEGHWYGFTDQENWAKHNANDFCGKFMKNMMNNFGFLLEQGYPVFLSEFGQDQRGGNVNDNRYFSCILGVIADLDMDWALWTLQGDYYLREGKQGMEEMYGVLSRDWGSIRNSSFLQRVQTVQPPFQGPGVSGKKHYDIIFHPASGLCVSEVVGLSPCQDIAPWSYNNTEKTIKVEGTDFYLEAVGRGEPADTGVDYSDSTKWTKISKSRLHLSSKLPSGETVCLDVDNDRSVVTNKCRCLTKHHKCDPTSQWFKIVTATTRATVIRATVIRTGMK